MTATSIDGATGSLLVDGKRVFPIGLSDPPPIDDTSWAEIAGAGVTFVRNYTVWTAGNIDAQMATVATELQAAAAHNLQVWLALAGLDNDLSQQALLDQVVNRFKGDPGLGAWKGPDEPAHGHVPAQGCVDVYQHLRSLDPDHPVVIIQAPRAPGPAPGTPDKPLTAAAVQPYAAACDIHGVDIYPIPPGAHAGHAPVNTDLSVVGDVTRIMVEASPGKAVWATLQIAWSGVQPPNHEVVFPNLQQARFMAYDAIIAGARGLFFFGGHIRVVMNPVDRQCGWNWTYWGDVQRPLVAELTGPAHAAALTAPVSAHQVRASAPGVRLSAREAGGFLYVIAVRRGPAQAVKVRFTGLPAQVTGGHVLAHGHANPARPIRVSGGAFTDPSPFAAHNARVYQFALSP
jgi:hypothetical protein